MVNMKSSSTSRQATLLPAKCPAALALIEEWYALRRTELVDNAERANRRESLNKILPLS
jgi:hypothetical protein